MTARSRLADQLDEIHRILVGDDVGRAGGPCPCCNGKVVGGTCESCGWDEYGGNVFMSDEWEEHRTPADRAWARKERERVEARRREIKLVEDET